MKLFLYSNTYIFFIKWKKVNFFLSCPGVEPGPGPYTLCEKGNFSLYVGKKNLGNLSLYMALHPIPSPHGGKIFPTFFISVSFKITTSKRVLKFVKKNMLISNDLLSSQVFLFVLVSVTTEKASDSWFCKKLKTY